MSEENKNRLYYSIGEVADMLKVNPSLIRFWEKEFDIIKPAKNRKGNRLFTPKDLENLKIIYHLVKECGFTLDGAREQLKIKADEIAIRVKTIETLNKIKHFLSQLKTNIDLKKIE